MLRHIVYLAFIALPTLLGQQITFQCPGSTYTVATGINNNGIVVGYYYGSSGGAHGFLYTIGSGTCTTFDVSNASNTFPQAINDGNVTSGYYQDVNFNYHGFIRSASGTITPFDYPNTTSNTVGFDINNNGFVIFISNTGVYFRDSSGNVTSVTFNHPVLLSKLGINDAKNVIVGTVASAQNPGCFIDSEPSGTSTSFSVNGSSATYCFDVNNGGTIAGTYFSSNAQFAFVRTASSVITLNGLTSASANGLNDSGQVVGSYAPSSGQVAAFVVNYTNTTGVPLGFYPWPPCRMVDTRAGQGKGGFFGPPPLVANTNRDFPLLSSGCNVPSTAQAYSLNATVVPPSGLGFLSMWPSGQPFPGVSTLNSPDGSIIANAALLPAGINGAITVMASQQTDFILDVNGYFAPVTGLEDVFYPVQPCRLVDTRFGQGKGGMFGPPSLVANMSRDFPLSSDGCLISGAAKAYSVNITAVPQGQLAFLSAWPTGGPYPGVSTLNSPDGSTIANAAIVPAGNGGSITILAPNPTDVVIDINGFFAPPGSVAGGNPLHFFPVTPCRVVDTRVGQGKGGAYGPPSLVGGTGRDFSITNGGCGIPGTAQAFALNMTVVPLASHLDYVSMWQSGQPYPGVSTLNSPKGITIANAAIVPSGANGSITVLAAQAADLILDINGYFAP